jgi:cytochrome c5
MKFFQSISIVFIGLYQVNMYALTNPSKGQTVYQQYCSICHESGLIGAPKFRDKKSWEERLSKKSISELAASAMKGLNAMPAQGTCYECTQQDLKSAIEYMISDN